MKGPTGGAFLGGNVNGCMMYLYISACTSCNVLNNLYGDSIAHSCIPGCLRSRRSYRQRQLKPFAAGQPNRPRSARGSMRTLTWTAVVVLAAANWEEECQSEEVDVWPEGFVAWYAKNTNMWCLFFVGRTGKVSILDLQKGRKPYAIVGAQSFWGACLKNLKARRFSFLSPLS